MNWADANAWAARLDLYGPSGPDGWRLPTVTDAGSPGCNVAYGGTDCGFNVVTSTGEMAHMYYDELGNLAPCDAGGVARSGTAGVDWAFVNDGPFLNLKADGYWSATEYAPDTALAWGLYFYDGG